MPTLDELKFIVQEIVGRNLSDDEIEVIRKACEGNDKINLHIAKYINYINHAQDSYFCDVTSQGTDTEAIKLFFQETLKALRITNTLHLDNEWFANQNQTPSPEVQRQNIRQFLEEIENSLKFITLSHKQQPISIKDQYIPVQVTLERHYQNEVEGTYIYAELDHNLKSFYKHKNKSKEAQQEQVDWQVFKEQHKTIMVLANPGMGKSTLLRMETISNAEQARQEIENGQNIENIVFPLYLRLADLADSPKDEEVFDSISRIIQRDYPNTAPINLVLLQQKLKLGQCLLLLDGLDEVLVEQHIFLS